MLTMIAHFLDSYDKLFTEKADARVYSWPLMSGPMKVLLITLIYIYFILSFGPNFMKNRKPYTLKNVLIVYNTAQIIASILLFHMILTSGWTTKKISLGCVPVDYSNDPLAVKMAGAIWFTMVIKLVEYVETVFFVLRKKQNQITFLHIYHHISTFWITWLGAKFIPGGMMSFCILVNCIVHAIMYTYYLLTIIGSPQVIELITKWKKYLTIIQMIQFTIIIAHGVQALNPNCNISKTMTYLFFPYIFLMFYLFYDFFRNMNKTKIS